MKIDQPFTCNIDQYWFRFQPKVMFPGTKTLDKAIERADLLVGKVLEDGWLQNMWVIFLKSALKELIKATLTV